MAKISFKGLDKLEKKLIENVKMEEVKKVVRDNGLTLQGNVVKNAGEATFYKGYFTGNLKQDVAGHGLKLSDGGLTATVGTSVEYGPHLEHGTRYMEAEPFLKDPFEQTKKEFKADIDKLAK